jgi:hypothetical protein
MISESSKKYHIWHSTAIRHSPPLTWIFPRISVHTPSATLFDPFVLPSATSTRAQCHGVVETALVKGQQSAVSCEQSTLVKGQQSAVSCEQSTLVNAISSLLSALITQLSALSSQLCTLHSRTILMLVKMVVLVMLVLWMLVHGGRSDRGCVDVHEELYVAELHIALCRCKRS